MKRTRREFVSSVGIGTVVAVAGCSGSETPDSESETPEPSPPPAETNQQTANMAETNKTSTPTADASVAFDRRYATSGDDSTPIDISQGRLVATLEAVLPGEGWSETTKGTWERPNGETTEAVDTVFGRFTHDSSRGHARRRRLHVGVGRRGVSNQREKRFRAATGNRRREQRMGRTARRPTAVAGDVQGRQRDGDGHLR